MDQRVVTVRALQAFEGYLWNEDRQRGTIEKYLRDVRAFAAWLGGGEVSRAEAVRWRDHLLNQGYAPATINSMVAALNTFFRFAGWEDCRVKFLKVQRKLFRDKSRELTRQAVEALEGFDHPEFLTWLARTLAREVWAAESGAGDPLALPRLPVDFAAGSRSDSPLEGVYTVVLQRDNAVLRVLFFQGEESMAVPLDT